MQLPHGQTPVDYFALPLEPHCQISFYMKEYHESNRNAIRESQKQYYEQNKDVMKLCVESIINRINVLKIECTAAFTKILVSLFCSLQQHYEQNKGAKRLSV